MFISYCGSSYNEIRLL